MGQNYIITVTGDAQYHPGNYFDGVICYSSFEGPNTVFVQRGDTLRFTALFTWISLFIVDHLDVDDNRGSFQIHLVKENEVRVNNNNTKLLKTFSLAQNYPNPFNPLTQIQYQVPQAGLTLLKIFNDLGQAVRTLVNEERTVGNYTTLWDGRDENGNLVASGRYFYRLKVGENVEARSMLLVK